MNGGKKYLLIFAIFAAIFAGLVYLYFNDPNLPNSKTPDCIFYRLTSLKCPGCGSTRALYALLHLNFKESFMQNPFVLLFVPFFVFAVVYPKILNGKLSPILLSISLILVTVIKNI